MTKTKMTEEEATRWPEHGRLYALEGKNEVVGNFIEWLKRHPDYRLCEWFTYTDSDGNETGGGDYLPVYPSTQDLLAEYFKIDQNALDREKDNMLAMIRQGAQ